MTRLGSLDIELTERCNNNCIHCCINLPANDHAAKAREMTTEQIKSILTQAEKLGCLQVRFTGGEPLLRTDFEGLYLFARRLGLKRDQGAATLAIVIGGPDGLAPEFRAGAAMVLSFGAMTFPHQLVRLLAAEQIYRAVTILAGHPYHRD